MESFVETLFLSDAITILIHPSLYRYLLRKGVEMDSYKWSSFRLIVIWYALREVDDGGHYYAIFTSFRRKAPYKDIGKCFKISKPKHFFKNYLLNTIGIVCFQKVSYLIEILRLIRWIVCWPPSLLKFEHFLRYLSGI